MPLKYSMLPSDSPEPSDSGEDCSPTGAGRQLAPRRASSSRPPSLIALPPGDAPQPRPARGPGRVLVLSAVVVTLVGIALFSFGMKYQPQSAPGLVDLVDPQPSRGEAAVSGFSGIGRPAGS